MSEVRVFVAGAAGAIGRQLLPMLLADGHAVCGTTRSPRRAEWIRSIGATPVVMDAFDADMVRAAVSDARPEVIVHQLTDLAGGFERSNLEANTRLRQVGTRNLVHAALAVGVGRLVAQGAAWLYARSASSAVSANEPLVESDSLLSLAHAPDNPVLPGILELERLVLGTPGIDGVVLRYGYLYGPGTAADQPGDEPSVHVSAAARAAALAVRLGEPGACNIVDDGQGISNERARAQLGWRPSDR
jgi:nucleoside-diphosphate-sugar epimerase